MAILDGMRDGSSQLVRFDLFELDLKTGELRREGVAVAMPPQQFTVLSALVEDPGALVTREQLRARLWGDDSFVDFDAGLNFCIRQLRLALGDTASQPRFIQTVPRRGYRFVAAIHAPEAPAKVAAASSVVTPPAASVKPPARWVTAAVAAVLTMAVASGAWWLIAADGPPAGANADHRIADAHAAHGFVALNDEWAWDKAERSFGRALQLDPQHEVALISMSRLRASQGRFAEAIIFARRALDAHPESLRALVTLGWSHIFAGDYQSALASCSQAAARQPNLGPAHQCQLNAEVELGTDHRLVWERLRQEVSVSNRPGSLFQQAWLTARLGRQPEALALLLRALDAREPDAMFAPVHPAFVGLRTHPDFIAATTRAGLREFSSSPH